MSIAFWVWNDITLLSRSSNRNIIIIIYLLTSHRLLSSTHHIRYILVWFWSQLLSLSAVVFRNIFACMYVCVCVCTRALVSFFFDDSVLSNSNRVKKDGSSTRIHRRHCRFFSSPSLFFSLHDVQYKQTFRMLLLIYLHMFYFNLEEVEERKM